MKKDDSAGTASCAQDGGSHFLRRGAWAAVGVASFVTLLVVWLVGARRWQIGVPGEWTWTYYETGESASRLLLVLPLFFAAVITAVAVAAVRRGLPTRAAASLSVAVMLAAALGLTLTLPDAGPFGGMDAVPVTANPWAGGYYAEAVHVQDLSEYTRNYAQRISNLDVVGPLGHIADHPIAPVLFHAMVNRAMESSPALARLFLPGDADATAQAHALVARILRAPVSDGQLAGIWASAFLFRMGLWLTLIPIYLLGCELRSREVGLVGVALASLIPALHVFGPYPDQFFPLIVVFSLYAWVLAARRRSMIWAAASAVALFLGLLWSMSLLMAGGCIAVASLLMLWQERAESGGNRELRRWATLAGAWAVAFALSVLIVRLLFGYHVVEVWKLCLSKHAGFATVFHRSYWPWTAFNPVEFAIFCGLPAFVMALFAAVTDAVRWWRSRRLSAPDALVWTALGVAVALDLSGKNLGEVARLWMPLMPLAALAGAAALAAFDRARGYVTGLLLVLMTAQLMVFKVQLDVFMISVK